MSNTLLNTPICNIKLQQRGSIAMECVQIVRDELKQKGIHFNFHIWVSDDWFCPDGITGIALPFYLFNSAVSKLEKEYVGEVEGIKKEECLKLIRHELGHAIDNAFNLRECEIRKELFGCSKIKYPNEYTPIPYSKKFVRHLSQNYAQAHPDEDWAETFAVWLDPNSDWKNKYKNWSAIKKLNYLDQVMKKIKGKRPRYICRDTLDEVNTIGTSLRTYLKRKSKNKNKYKKPIFNRGLNRIFTTGNKNCAMSYLKVYEEQICLKVAKSTNQYHYIVRDVLKELKSECKSKNLSLKYSKLKTHDSLVNLLTRSTQLYVKQGKNKVIM